MPLFYRLSSARALMLLGCLLTVPASVTAAEITPVHAAPAPQQTPPELPALAPNEPMYFIVGGNGGTTARFQFSFQYRIFDEQSAIVDTVPLARRLYFAYTQTSLWNLSEESRPFADTSYRPSLFWQGGRLRPGLIPGLLRLGFEHESNGRQEEDSRSLDTLFAMPIWHLPLGDANLVIGTQARIYLDQEENPHISRYRGHVDYLLRYGREHGLVTSAVVRKGRGNYGSIQLDVSYPIRQPIFFRSGGFLYLQLFHGYGESLLEYDQRETLQVRAGIGIVR